jgi:crotonobetainyl-CoA:carnitine CoA-transferase CaiB-like acyl-CoA transferase
MPTFPVRFDGATAKVGRSPLLGEHNSEILHSWLELSEDDIATLKKDGIA